MNDPNGSPVEAEPDTAHPPLFIVEEWEKGEGSEVTQILLDEKEARQIWANDRKEARAQPRTRSHGTQVRRWVFVRGKYELDGDWPPIGRG